MRGIFPAILAGALMIPASSPCGVGRSAGQTMTQPISARPAGLAEAYSAEASGADSLGYNPAGLSLASGQEILAQYHGGFAGDSFISLAYAQPAGKIGLAAAIYSYNSGSVDLLDKYNVAVAAVGQRDLVYSAGFGMALPLEGLSAGASVKFLDTQLAEEYSGRALAGDAGIRFDVPDTGFSLAGSMQNIGAGIRIGGGNERLPGILRLGAAYRLDIEAEGSRIAGLEGIMEPGIRPEPAEHRAIFLCDGIFRLGDRISSLAVGGEYSYHGFFALRAGGRFPMHGTGMRNAAFTAGFGAKMRAVTADYSLEAVSPTALHRVSMSFVF